MEYEAFKEAVLAGVQEIYGGAATARVKRLLKNNGCHYDGILTAPRGEEESVCPAIPLEWFYRLYKRGDMSVAGCAQTVCKISEEHRELGNVLKILQENRYWEQVKGSIYPVLLSTKENQEVLENLAATPMLDMSVAYIIRKEAGERCIGIKVSRTMLEAYGVSVEQLHGQALENLRGDGYEFCEIQSFVTRLGCQVPEELDIRWTGEEEKVFVFTNTVNFYGAAGILDRKRVREFAVGRDFFILPSSIHETIFVLAEDKNDIEKYSSIVRMVNRTALDEEQRLSDHAYFYDAAADEIRVCI